MTRPLAPLYLAAGMVAGLWGGQLGGSAGQRRDSRVADDGQQRARYSRQSGAGPSALPPLLSQLDALDARIAALAYPDPRHCDDACLTGVERVELKRGAVSCRCRRLPSLGVHRLPEAGR